MGQGRFKNRLFHKAQSPRIVEVTSRQRLFSIPAKSHGHQWDLDHCIYLVNISTAELDNCISLFSKIG